MVAEQEYSELIDRIIEAQNSQNADRVAELVAENYRSETPFHPERDFAGREQVRRNWQAVFESVSDLDVELLRSAVDETTIWLEVHMTGTQTDGTELDMRGVAIWGVEDGLLQWGRIYAEPVQRHDDVTWEELFTPEDRNISENAGSRRPE